jgi:hypothetical protein
MKVGDKVKYDGEAHLIVNIVDGYPVMVPMSVIDDECFIIEYEGDGCHEFDLIPIK